MPALQEEQHQYVSRPVALRVICLCMQPGEQREQLLLQGISLRVGAVQARQNGGHDEALLGLPHVFTDGRQCQPMLDEARQPALLDLARRLRNELRCGILQHHRLQREAPPLVPTLNQRAAAQRLHRFQHLYPRQRRAQHREQLLDAHQLAQDRQPQQHGLLFSRQARELLPQQLSHAAEDQLAPGEEPGDFAPEELRDGLSHDFEGQRVASIRLDQPLPFRRGTHQLPFL